jgi:hypothetical protein
MLTADDPAYPFGKRPPDGAPKTLTPFPELQMGRDKAGTANESLLNTPEWRSTWANNCWLKTSPAPPA